MEKGYWVVIAKNKNNYSAHIPDFPGCIATGKTLEDIKRNIIEALLLHIKGMQEDGIDLPKPHFKPPIYWRIKKKVSHACNSETSNNNDCYIPVYAS